MTFAESMEKVNGEKGMLRTTFSIPGMDCPSEERMIRMKLEGIDTIESLEFDIPGRSLDVYHTGSHENIFSALGSLQLKATIISSRPADKDPGKDSRTQQSRVLWQVLSINFFFFVLEILTGFISGSMGLVADSLDMLADTIVYGMSLIAVGGTVALKKRIAGAAGYFQLFLAVLGFAEVVRRFVGQEGPPDFQLMIIISVLALAGNVTCLYLLQRSKSREAHMQASMIFTSNDVIANIGIIVAGILVFLTASQIPDLTIGAVVFILVARGAYRILQLSK